ncbi:MAG: signal peptidase I [Clostridia bacterium]|nr:signal peptidase I [Clostridia bacterium]
MNFKKIWNIITTVIVVIVVVFAVLLVGLRLVGVQVYSVISGSMEPEYPVGALIYVKEVDPAEVKVGDVITFVLSNDMPATHRVIAIDAENQHFYTRGDANFNIDEITGEKIYTEDPPVHFKNLIGKPIFKIPFLGYVAYYVQHPPGMYIALAVGAIILALAFLPDIFAKTDKTEKKKETAPAEDGEKTESPQNGENKEG